MVPPPSTTPASRCSSAHGANDNGDQPAVSKSNYMSGNDQPGYPPNSPQQQSLCNSSGYPGQSGQSEYGDQTTNGTSYQTNQKSPAYNHPSPGYPNQNNYQNYHISPEQHQQVQKSPSQKNNCYQQENSNHYSTNSPNYEMYDHRQSGQYYGELDKNNVNARIKNMIMNKQGRGDHLTSPNNKDHPPNDYGGKKSIEANEESNHFLAFSHHLREGSLLQPGGGGYQHWDGHASTPNHNYDMQYYTPYDCNQNTKENGSAMEKFMKFAATDFEKFDKKTPTISYDYQRYHDPIRNLEKNFPTKRGFENNNNTLWGYNQFDEKSQQEFYCHQPKEEFPNITNELHNVKIEPKTEDEVNEEDSVFPKISYAPWTRRMEVIDRRFSRVPPKECEKWEEYRKKMNEERLDVKVKKEENYPFAGDGGPVCLESQGAWCCRQGGTEKPTPDHLRDGCCQGAQVEDSSIEQSEENQSISPNNCDSDKKGGDHLDSKNVIRSDVPECSCFPPDKGN